MRWVLFQCTAWLVQTSITCRGTQRQVSNWTLFSFFYCYFGDDGVREMPSMQLLDSEWFPRHLLWCHRSFFSKMVKFPAGSSKFPLMGLDHPICLSVVPIQTEQSLSAWHFCKMVGRRPFQFVMWGTICVFVCICVYLAVHIYTYVHR